MQKDFQWWLQITLYEATGNGDVPRECVTLQFNSHHSHVVLWLYGDLQHFGPIDHPLHAWSGDSLPCDTVHLVEGVGFEEPLVCRPYEDLQHQRSCALVSTELVRTTTKYMYGSNWYKCINAGDCRVTVFSLWGWGFCVTGTTRTLLCIFCLCYGVRNTNSDGLLIHGEN